VKESVGKSVKKRSYYAHSSCSKEARSSCPPFWSAQVQFSLLSRDFTVCSCSSVTSASSNCAQFKVAPRIFASIKFAPVRSAPVRSASARFAPRRSLNGSFASSRLAPMMQINKLIRPSVGADYGFSHNTLDTRRRRCIVRTADDEHSQPRSVMVHSFRMLYAP
jgi:hypothetical protein